MPKTGQLAVEGSEVEKFKALFRELPAGLALLRGPELVFEMANEDYIEMIGHRDIIGRPLIEALPELKDQKFPDILRKVLETGKAFQAREIEVLLHKDPKNPKNLTPVYVDLTYRRILNGEGKPYGIFVFAVEVTEKVKSRRGISLERQKLESVFVNSSSALAILRGPEAIFEKANSIYSNLFKGRDLIEKPLLKALPELDGQKFPSLIDQVYKTGEAYSEVEAVAHLRQNDNSPLEKKYFDQSYTRINDTEGNRYGVLIQAIDVTERVINRERLANSLAARSEFLSIASHELRTPLTSLKLQTQTMRRNYALKRPDALAPDRINNMISNSERQIDRLTRLVDDMLDFARIEAGKMAVHKEPTNLTELVKDVFERHIELNEARTALVTLKADVNLMVEADQFRIEQVVVNLITNALRYGQGSDVSIIVEKRGSRAVIAVSDKGMGISLENQERIFNRFERAVSANEISGLGLGLFICREIISAHQGKISVESEIGKGSTFLVELPLL